MRDSFVHRHWRHAFDCFRQQILGNYVKLSPQIIRTLSWRNSQKFLLKGSISSPFMIIHSIYIYTYIISIYYIHIFYMYINIYIYDILGVTSQLCLPSISQSTNSSQELQCFYSLHQDGGGRRISFHRSDLHRGLSFAFQCLGRWTWLDHALKNIQRKRVTNDWHIETQWSGENTQTIKQIYQNGPHTATLVA